MGRWPWIFNLRRHVVATHTRRKKLMSISVFCIACGEELESPGAILLGPPDEDDLVIKSHLCEEHYNLVDDYICWVSMGCEPIL